MSDHYHHASEIRGAADDRHGHSDLERDISSVESDLRNHRHYDDERELASVRRDLDRVIGDLRELRGELEAALGRIRELEEHFPDDDESWRNTLADYHVASGGADYDEDGPDCGCGLGAARCRALEDGEVPE